MTQWTTPNTIKSIAETLKSNIKALNPFNFTHPTGFPIEFDSLLLKKTLGYEEGEK